MGYNNYGRWPYSSDRLHGEENTHFEKLFDARLSSLRALAERFLSM